MLQNGNGCCVIATPVTYWKRV